MRFYKYSEKLWDESIEKDKVFPSVNAKYIQNGKKLFGDAFTDGLIIHRNVYDDDLLLETFELWDFEKNKRNDWILLDTYAFQGTDVAISLRGNLISNKLKNILESVIIAKPSKFYPSKLNYHEEKLDYFLFQMAHNEWNSLVFESCEFYRFEEKSWIKQDIIVHDQDSLLDETDKWVDSKENYKVKLVFDEYRDIFWMQDIGFCISETLKDKIESNGITGVEITPLENLNISFLND